MARIALIRLSLGCGLLLCISSALHGASPDATWSQEQIVAKSLARAIQQRLDNEGSLPESWDDLKPYVRVDKMERSLGGSLADAYVFGPTQKRSLGSLRGKQVIGVGRKSTHRKGGSGPGRYVIILDHGKVRAQWSDEPEALRVLQGEAVDEEQPLPIPGLDLDVEVTNDKGVLLAGEPLSVCVQAVSPASALSVVPRFVFEVRTPEGVTNVIPLCGLHFLGDSVDERAPDFTTGTNGDSKAMFYAVLWLLPSQQGYDMDAPQVITAQHGTYSVQIRETVSGASSKPVAFVVMATPDEDAARAFLSPKAIRAFFGDPDASSEYEQLVAQYAGTRYAGIASSVLGLHRFATFHEQVGKADRQELQNVVTLLRDPECLGTKSLLALRSLYARAVCRARLGEKAKSQHDYQRIAHEYESLRTSKVVAKASRAISAVEE